MPSKHRNLTCSICKKYPIRSDHIGRHMKTHKKKYGEGLWTQKVNEQMKLGHGLRSKYDLDENQDAKIIKDEIGIDPGNDIDKYVWHRPESREKSHSSLLPRDIRAIIIGKSGSGKTVFLTYLLLEHGLLDYDSLLVCGPSLNQPTYKILRDGFDRKLSKNQVRYLLTNQEMVESQYGTVDNLLANYGKRCKGGIDSEFINDVASIPDPSNINSDKKTVLVLDDVMLCPQNKAEDYYTRGRHSGVDTFYISQNYFRLPRQTIRENSNFIVLFPQDLKNLSHIYSDHCAGDGISCKEFIEFCNTVWKSGKHKFVIIDLTRDVDDGKYRESLSKFWIPTSINS